MTTFFDTSAVVAAHIDIPQRQLVIDELDDSVCVSALALTEALAVIDRLTDDVYGRADLGDAIRLQWDRYAVVPVDQRCLDHATELLRQQPLRLADAIQLAAAARLPKPVRFVTFDPAQIPVALSLGYEVVSS